MIRQKRQQAFLSLYASMGLIAVSCIFFSVRPVMIAAGALGLLAFAYYLYLSFRYWRCPACHEQFPVVYSRMDERTECWHCLAPLDGSPISPSAEQIVHEKE